jgi:hypothetical protein
MTGDRTPLLFIIWAGVLGNHLFPFRHPHGPLAKPRQWPLQDKNPGIFMLAYKVIQFAGENLGNRLQYQPDLVHRNVT